MYLIRVTRHYYRGTIHDGNVSYVGQHGLDRCAPILPFDSLAEAQEAKRAMGDGVYYLGNGEYAPPTFRIVQERQWPGYVRSMI